MLVDLLLYVKQERVRHVLVTTSSDPEILTVVRQAGVLSYQPTTRFRYGPGKFIQMARWLQVHNVQVVHSYNAFANAWANITTLLSGTPAFITGKHGTTSYTPAPIALLERVAHRRARLVIANSQATAKTLTLKYGIPVDKIRVVRNAVADLPFVDTQQVRAQLGIPEDVLVVGSVGRLDTPKDYATLVDAASLVLRERQDVSFVLIGGGPHESELRAYVSKLGIQDRFLMTGWRGDARVLIQGFDLFVSTSVQESFGNAMVEAALCEKAVIAPRIEGIPEVVVHEQTGLLLQPMEPVKDYQSPGASALPQQVLIDGKLQPPRALNSEMLAKTILDLLSNSELRAYYGRQAKERAQRLFSIERYVQELENIYLEVGRPASVGVNATNL